jgi:hypothetical protein
MMVKSLLLAAALALGGYAAAVNTANAWTCQERAARCQELGGRGCFEAARMASCQKTHTYVAPSGNVWRANGKPHKK